MVLGFDLFWSVIVIATLGGAAIFTEALQSISICKEVLPLCFTFVTKVFIIFFYLHNLVYSVKKMPVGSAAIITKLTKCHVILLASKRTIYQKYCCVGFLCLIFYSYFVFIHRLILLFSYSFCTGLLNLFAQINLIAYNIKTSVDA